MCGRSYVAETLYNTHAAWHAHASFISPAAIDQGVTHYATHTAKLRTCISLAICQATFLVGTQCYDFKTFNSTAISCNGNKNHKMQNYKMI
jgi:hypothetical protein